MQFLENDFWLSYVPIYRYHHLLENHKKRRQQKFRDGYTRGKTKEKRASEQLYKVSDKSPSPSFLQSVLPAKAWRAIFTFRQKEIFIFKPLTLLLSAHFFSLSSSPWQTLNRLWKVLGTTFPRFWKKISAMPFKFQVPVIDCWLARILVQVF